MTLIVIDDGDDEADRRQAVDPEFSLCRYLGGAPSKRFTRMVWRAIGHPLGPGPARVSWEEGREPRPSSHGAAPLVLGVALASPKRSFRSISFALSDNKTYKQVQSLSE